MCIVHRREMRSCSQQAHNPDKDPFFHLRIEGVDAYNRESKDRCFRRVGQCCIVWPELCFVNKSSFDCSEVRGHVERRSWVRESGGGRNGVLRKPPGAFEGIDRDAVRCVTQDDDSYSFQLSGRSRGRSPDDYGDRPRPGNPH